MTPSASEINQKQSRQFLGTLIVIFTLVAFFQWPKIKEMYYEATDAEIPESAIRWRDDYESALSEAKSSGKPLLVVFGASWCPPSKVMKREVWPNTEVSDTVLESFVPLYVDIDLQQHRTVVQRFNVRSIPAVIVVGGEGQILRQAGAMSRAKTIKFLDASRA